MFTPYTEALHVMKATLLLFILKMMGLAFEVHDSEKDTTNKDSDEETIARKKYRLIDKPSPQDIFHYAFCHAGILTGVC